MAEREARGEVDPTGPALSFLHLVELAVVARLRRDGHGRRPASLERLRRAHLFLRASWPEVEFPFASLDFLERGGRALHTFDEAHPNGAALALDAHGRWILPAPVARVLERIDFSIIDRQAERWFPAGREIPIVLDPRIGGARPTIKGRGITVETVYRRFQAGETIASLADDYELDQATVEAALRYADPTLLVAA